MTILHIHIAQGSQYPVNRAKLDIEERTGILTKTKDLVQAERKLKANEFIDQSHDITLIQAWL